MAAAGVDAFLIEPYNLRLETLHVPIVGLDPVFDGYKIGLLADLHYPRFASFQTIQQAVARLNAFQPDVVALPGDLVAQRQGIDDVPDFSGLFSNLKVLDGAFATLGNHDHWVDARIVRSQVTWNTPFEMLEHKSRVIERGSAKLGFAGVGDLWTGSVNIDDAVDEIPEDVPRILLCHNPDVAEQSRSQARVDLMLSGHTHGGQICLPGGKPITVPSAYGDKFARGLVQGARYRVYVTRGVCSVLGARFWCPPEVTGIILRSA